MGRMKELFMQQLEQDKGKYAEYMREINDVTSPTDILCPNCMKDKLFQYSSVDLSCTKCGYEFIKIDDNTVRFK